jgi:TM2 domain-containing membrane protein YozV
MALTEEQKKKIEEEEEYRMQVAASVTPSVKQKHGVPALLSFFIPGLGQIVKGQVVKGIFTFIGFGLGILMFVIPGVIVWIMQIVDAYND